MIDAMSPLFSDENVDRRVVAELRRLGCDVLTAREAGRANRRIPDPDVLAHAATLGRAVLTMNRRDFHKLHILLPAHAGVVTCTDDRDCAALAQRIHNRISTLSSLAGQLVRVTKAG
jgi:predicted nuclease of predicted toxin-antitoxin system